MHGYVIFYVDELSVRRVVILTNVTRPLVLALLAWPRTGFRVQGYHSYHRGKFKPFPECEQDGCLEC